MADWVDVTEEQHDALAALGAPVRVVHQAKVPKQWDVTALGGGRCGRGKGLARRKTARLATDHFRLGAKVTPPREGTNIGKVYEAIKASLKGSLSDTRSRTSMLNTANKALPGLHRDNISAVVSHLCTGGYLVYDEEATREHGG